MQPSMRINLVVSLLNQFLPAGVYISDFSDVVLTKQALYPIKLLVNFILPHQPSYFSVRNTVLARCSDD